jgi:hypothetical protein
VKSFEELIMVFVGATIQKSLFFVFERTHPVWRNLRGLVEPTALPAIRLDERFSVPVPAEIDSEQYFREDCLFAPGTPSFVPMGQWPNEGLPAGGNSYPNP